MSQENMDVFRSIIEDYLVGSGASSWEAWIAGIADLMDPAIEWDASRAPMPDIAEICRGKEAVLHWWREWFAAWETLEFEYELVDAGDSVVMLLDQRMRGRSTGIEVPMGEYAHVATFRNGLMVHWTYYASQSQALEAVGLSEQPVSQENVELATRAIDAWNRLDLDSFMEVWHVEAEWRPAFPKGTEGTGSVFRGHDGIRDAWRNVRTAWSVYDVQPQEIRMAGDSLLVLGRIHARGEASGLEIDSDWSAVLRYRDGKLITAWDWLDHRSALEAVGLSE